MLSDLHLDRKSHEYKALKRYTNVDLINQPLLMIAGDKADSLYMSEEVFKNASGTANKELFLVKGASHIQTYWQPEYVKEISVKLKDFFGKNL